MLLPAIRGVLLEELVLYLLGLVGYRIVNPNEEGTKPGKSGLEVKGRGEWHQIDALAAFDKTPAFMYPLRLMVEAKCYARNRPVQIEVVRNTVGVLKDISENYFTYSAASNGKEIQVPRFNYHSAIFSTSGYTKGAQRYAIAHQIFLIQYERIQLLRPIVDALLGLTFNHVINVARFGNDSAISGRIRKMVRKMFKGERLVDGVDGSVFTDEGLRYILENVVRPLLGIRGSYFGMLQGKWPMHLLSRHPLPTKAFARRDEVLCRVYGREANRWSFSPVNVNEGSPTWFRLEFDIPDEILEFVKAARHDPLAVAEVKQQHFSYLDVAGRIGGVQRQVRLRLDEEWFEAYLERIRSRS